MTKQNGMLLGWAASIAIGLSAGGAAIGAGNGTSGDPIACQIEQSRSGGMIMLEGVVTSTQPVTGHYAFSVRGPGANINQGGDFEAAAGEAVSLGSIMIGANGTSHDVRLEVTAAGYSATCSERAGTI